MLLLEANFLILEDLIPFLLVLLLFLRNVERALFEFNKAAGFGILGTELEVT